MTTRSQSTSQEQFLEVIDRDEAERRFLQAIHLQPLGTETEPLTTSLGRLLARDVTANVDVPSFDRSNLDGFAVRAADTFGATEEEPKVLKLSGEVIPTAHVPQLTVTPGVASPIATGGMVPRGADAVVMIEHTEAIDDEVLVRKSVSPGTGVSFAGTDIGAGETVLRQGDRLTSRETGVLAAIGHDHVCVWRRPRVAIISTGDEIVSPGQPMQPGLVYDSNAQILADAVTELGGVPVRLGTVHDDVSQLRAILKQGLEADVVLLSGGTSKGAGDISYQVVSELDDPGIVAHGVALKPGKPICLAASKGKPVVILPGFPTSAVFTFHEFVAPVIRRLSGAAPIAQDTVPAQLAVKVNSEVGRTEYLLVGLVNSQHADSSTALTAYPMGKGSGSVTTFSHADGFVTVGRHEEIVPQGRKVQVQLLGSHLEIADLVVIGSHCVGVDVMIGAMQQDGFRGKFLAVGSTAGLTAAQRGECDIAGIHLLDPESGEYNHPFVDERVVLIPGYTRQQGIVFRRGDDRFESCDVSQALNRAFAEPHCVMINRNQGSGTRVVIEQLLQGRKPEGYAVQPKSHNAVAAAIAQGRADWGLAIERVAQQLDLGFLPVANECFDFAIPTNRLQRPAVQHWLKRLKDEDMRQQFRELGLIPRDDAT